MKILIAIALMFSTHAFSVDKNSTTSMIDGMVNKGILTPEQAAAAKAKMAGMPDQDWHELSKKAREIASKTKHNPSVELSVDDAAREIDFDSKQFKDIQKSVKGIMGNP